MSILLDPPTLTRRSTPGKAVFWFCCAVLVSVVASSWGGRTLILSGMNADSGGWHEAVTANSPALVFRRILFLLFILTTAFCIKRIGWRGLRDLGWSSAQTRGERKKDLLIWMFIGVGFSILCGLILMWAGRSMWLSRSWTGWISWLFVEVLVMGILFTIVWESFVRGMVYRTLSGLWGSWGATLVVSVTLAWLHSGTVSVDQLEQGTWSTLTALLGSPFAAAAEFRSWINWMLLGIMCCRLVHHKGDIWASVGLHGAMFVGLNLFSGVRVEQDVAVQTTFQSGFRFFSSQSTGFTFALLLFWGLLEWQHRRKLSTYGRVHF